MSKRIKLFHKFSLLPGSQLFSSGSLKPERILILVLEKLQEPLTGPVSTLLEEAVFINLVCVMCASWKGRPMSWLLGRPTKETTILTDGIDVLLLTQKYNDIPYFYTMENTHPVRPSTRADLIC